MYHRNRNPFDASQSAKSPAGTAFPSSVTTSAPQWMGDYAQISVQVASNSTVTILGTNKDGWNNALTAADCSTITLIPGTAAAGVYKIEPGFDWAIFVRNISTNTVQFVGQSRS